MIKRYTDHSANERTYLAWIRTAIAIMAFGFLIEKFDLFVSYLGRTLGSDEKFQSSLLIEYIGLAHFLVGIVIVISATARFFLYKRLIENDQPFPYSVKRSNLLLSGMMLMLGLFLIIYLAYQII